ncbi:uncharacterized protein LOC143453328 isoform X1 [Clavelina lepadiformis]|uniref:uncharacterized protein LOC143453328 isoform X1 n=1 Tax=Clavelina lepadiformis TaxID=159417 RepID=UPI004040FD6A
MYSADQSSPKEPEEASASGSLERPTFISTITTETFYPLPDGETCHSFIGGSPRNPIPCSFFESFKDDEWRETSYFTFLIAFGMLSGLVCLGFLIYVIKTAIKGGDQNEHAQDREHNVEMKVIERSRSPEGVGEGRCEVAEIEDQQSLSDTSVDESTQDDKREVVEHAAVERTEDEGEDKNQRNRNEIVVHALVERAQDDEVEYQDEYQELQLWDETSSQGYQGVGEGRCEVAEIEDQQSLSDTSVDESTQGNRNEIVVHALVERSQDDEVEYQDEYQDLSWWDETSSQGYQSDKV